MWGGRPAKGTRTRNQTGWGAGCNEAISELTVGALPRDGGAKELKGLRKCLRESAKASG